MSTGPASTGLGGNFASARLESVLDRLTPIEPAPKGFHPAKATDEELLRHGLPLKPDADRHPKHHDKWHRTMARPLRPMAPEFKVMEDRIHLPIPPHVTNNATTATWSGGVVTTPPAEETFTTVSATWIVPNVYPP